MLTPMTERVFLGWDRPFLERAVAWLLERRDDLPHWLVLVPTSQSGRRLREALAQQAGGAVLSPKIATPGSLLKTPGPEVAADWMERVAWLETLEGIADWENYQELFPQSPAADSGWAHGLAAELTSLRRRLQENGLTLNAAARALAESVEAGRWQALAKLENLMERKLHAWGLQSRSKVLAQGVKLPPGITAVVLAGTTEMPPLLDRALLAWDGPVTALIAAPESEAEAFSPLGRPLLCWTERIMPWPEKELGSVLVVADPRQEAAEAYRVVAEQQTPSDEVALGSADPITGDELAHVFTRAGWPAFHPAAQALPLGLARWFRLWSSWLKDPKLAILADLLTMPETAVLVGGRREEKASRLARLRNEWMAIRPQDLRQRIQSAEFRHERDQCHAEELLTVVTVMEHWRSAFLSGDFDENSRKLLEMLAQTHEESAAEAAVVENWLVAAVPVMRQVKRGASFWIDLMLDEVPASAPLPPDGRVIDVQGWLELLYEPGRHLVLCGMNEGKVPARNMGDPWLGEAAGAKLGLLGNAHRAARDAFLYQAMFEARRNGGRVDVFCAKSGSGGEVLLPSRLLLAARRDELPQRVKFLFKGVEPPEAGMRWHADWKWQPRKVEELRKLSVTSFSTWLSCPFRFYLKHALRMQTPEPGRVEWNARDFGNVAHRILERWGRDSTAHDLTMPDELHEWLSAALDETVSAWFGKQPPLSVRLQTESLRQRLAWFAKVQGPIREQGWQPIEIEKSFTLQINDTVITGTYDRLDRHLETGALRVIDYKTGKVDAVEKEHRSKIVATTVLPQHVTHDCPVVHTVDGTPYRWKNLQLPLYALALRQSRGVLPSPCYFHFGATEANVKLDEWKDFPEDDLTAASACAEWIASQIAAGVFWPPVEKAIYDDFAILTAGRTLKETCLAPA